MKVRTIIISSVAAVAVGVAVVQSCTAIATSAVGVAVIKKSFIRRSFQRSEGFEE